MDFLFFTLVLHLKLSIIDAQLVVARQQSRETEKTFKSPRVAPFISTTRLLDFIYPLD